MRNRVPDTISRHNDQSARDHFHTWRIISQAIGEVILYAYISCRRIGSMMSEVLLLVLAGLYDAMKRELAMAAFTLFRQES